MGLGGLVSQGLDQRVTLHHLLFRDYLTAVVFAAREVKRWHQRLADWCATDLDTIWADDHDPIEQARRVYARHHYVMHLALAENWTTLWQVLDAGDYGEQKTRFDPSTRLYALDLDRGRESAINAGQSTEEHIQNLPRLWKYSLLRTSLTSRVDQWPDDLFVVLVMLGRTQEALERIELISDTKRKFILWRNIIQWCDYDQQWIIASRVKGFVSGSNPSVNLDGLVYIMNILSMINNFNDAIIISQNITDNYKKITALIEIGFTAFFQNNMNYVIHIIEQVSYIIEIINHNEDSINILLGVATILAITENPDRAIFSLYNAAQTSTDRLAYSAPNPGCSAFGSRKKPLIAAGFHGRPNARSIPSGTP